jgi:hypothetical protein
MLMDFQIEGGQAVAAEIAAERQGFLARHRPVPKIERQTGWADNRAVYPGILTVPIFLAVLISGFIIVSRFVV